MSSDVYSLHDSKLWLDNNVADFPGFTIEKDGHNIATVSSRIIKEIMADAMRNKLISKLEQMDTDQILKYFGLED
jgi:hypothetical protein